MFMTFVLYTAYDVLTIMQGEKGERWRNLCEQAASEQDPQKLMELAHEMDRLLEAKEQRLKEQRTNSLSWTETGASHVLQESRSEPSYSD
jgi:hypothetical protein